jgi:hypothetical protein
MRASNYKNPPFRFRSKIYGWKGHAAGGFQSADRIFRLTNEEFIIMQQKKNIFSELARITKLILDENTRIALLI